MLFLRTLSLTFAFAFLIDYDIALKAIRILVADTSRGLTDRQIDSIFTTQKVIYALVGFSIVCYDTEVYDSVVKKMPFPESVATSCAYFTLTLGYIIELVYVSLVDYYDDLGCQVQVHA